jgi:NitT/TauT family transport system substrate-binding protein
MDETRRRFCATLGRGLLATGVWSALPAPAYANARTVRVAAQATGTLAWELDVALAQKLPEKYGLRLDIVRLATPEAQKIALKGGSANVIVADWLWVALERSLGGDLLFHPFSSALGSLMAPVQSRVRALSDLRGRKLGVAGGPLDKSWTMLRALALREGVDLRREADVVFGAPPLLAQKARQGELDAVLIYWNFAAELEAAGLRVVMTMQDVQSRLGAKGSVALIGYVFKDSWASREPETATRFLAMGREAKQILLTSDAEWGRLAPLIRASDDAGLSALRDRYREGVPTRAPADEWRDAGKLLSAMVESIGQDAVAGVKTLDRRMFYEPGA